jgi:hypothetical protein
MLHVDDLGQMALKKHVMMPHSQQFLPMITGSFKLLERDLRMSSCSLGIRAEIQSFSSVIEHVSISFKVDTAIHVIRVCIPLHLHCTRLYRFVLALAGSARADLKR